MKTRSFRGEDEVQCAAVNLPRVKRRGVPRERTMGTGCISKISVSVSEDINLYCKCSRCEESVLNRRSNLKKRWRWVVRGIIQILKS